MKLTWELHELSSGFSAILYDEHGQAIDTHLTEQQAKTIAHRVNVHDELVAALAGMLAINDSVTQGQEREYREKFLPMARAALERAEQ